MILFIVLIVGCTGNIDKRDAINWWNENETVALEILKLLKSTHLVKRVEIDTRKELITNYKNFDDRAWTVYRGVEKIMKNSKLEVITTHYLDGFFILEMIIDRYGYAIGEGGGCYLSVVYYNNANTYENMIKHVVYSEKLKSNWYLEINGDKECIRHAK